MTLIVHALAECRHGLLLRRNFNFLTNTIMAGGLLFIGAP